MTVFMFELAILYHHLSENQIGFVVMYPFTFFFANFGPVATTFIIPAEYFLQGLGQHVMEYQQ